MTDPSVRAAAMPSCRLVHTVHIRKTISNRLLKLVINYIYVKLILPAGITTEVSGILATAENLCISVRVSRRRI